MSIDSKRPRLAYLFSRYPVVSHTFCDNEILALEQAGWEVMVGSLYPPKNDLRHERLNASRVPVLYAPPSPVQKAMEARAKKRGTWPQAMVEAHDRRFGKNLKSDQRCRNILYFAEILSRLGVDHAHIHFANRATHSALFLKALTGITFSFTPQAQDFLIDLESPELLAEMCREAAFVVAPCDYAREKLLELCPGTPAKILKVYNGIDPSGYALARPKHGRLRVVSVGRLIEFKGFRHLLAAMAHARKAGVLVDLDLMGDGPLRGALEEQAARLGLREQVCFHGSVRLEQMKEAFGRADVFALACTMDAKGATDVLPTVITEAMLSGLPVLSSRVAGVPEQVVDGETGLLTEAGDERALGAALTRFATEPELAARLGAAGRKRAVEIFSIQSTMRDLTAAFASVPGKSRAPERYAVAAYYDLADARQLVADAAALKKENALVLVRAPTRGERGLEKLKLPLERFFWLPDGMTLEMEWFNRWQERALLEQWRAELSTAVDGEVFFEAARRALWWHCFLRNLGGIRQLHAPTPREALMVWLTSRLSGIPFSLGSEPLTDDKKLVKRIEKEAVATCAKSFWHGRALRRTLTPGQL